MVQGGPGFAPQHPAHGPVGIGPSHPSHPHHQQWVHAQQQRQDDMRMMELQNQAQGMRGPPGGQGMVGSRPPPRSDPRNQPDPGYNPALGQHHPQSAFINSNQYNIGPQPSGSMPISSQGLPPQAHLRAGSAGGYVPNPGPAGVPNGAGTLPLSQQRPIPISRNSLSGQPGTQQFGPGGMMQSPVQAGPGPGPYRVLSQAGSVQGRASPAPGRPGSIAGSIGGMNEIMRTPQQLAGGLPDRGAGQPHPAILGAALAASGISPLSAMSSPVGPALAKLTAYHDALGAAFERPKDQVLDAMRWVIAEFFSPHAVVKFTLYDNSSAAVKRFEVPCTALPRMNSISAHCGAVAQATRTNRVREYLLSAIDPQTRQPAHVGYLLEAGDVAWTTRYNVGSVVEMTGRLTVHFAVTGPGPGGPAAVALRMESFHFEANGREQFVSREAFVHEKVERLIETGDSLDEVIKRKREEEEEEKVKVEGKKGKRGSMGTRRKSQLAEEEEQEKRRKEGCETERWDGLEGITYDKVRVEGSEVGLFGLPEMGMRCLEIAESVAQLQDLIAFSVENGLGPIKSLEQFVDRWRAGQEQHQPAYPAHPGSYPNAGNGMVASPPPLSASGGGPGPNGAAGGVAPSPRGQGQGGHGTGAGAGAKRKATGPLPPRTPTPGQGLGDVSMLGEEGEEGLGSPAGGKPGGAGRGRGRGRG